MNDKISSHQEFENRLDEALAKIDPFYVELVKEEPAIKEMLDKIHDKNPLGQAKAPPGTIEKALVLVLASATEKSIDDAGGLQAVVDEYKKNNPGLKENELAQNH